MSKGDPVVAVVKAKYDPHLKDKILKVFKLIGSLKVENYSKVAIKINLCDARSPDTGAITHPLFLDAFLTCFRDIYPDVPVYVVESDSSVVLADEYVNWFGFTKVFEKHKVTWVNLSKTETTTVNLNGGYFEKLKIPKILVNSYIVSMAKLKTNSLTKISCCLKNMFGCLPKIRKYIYHSHIDDVIADLNSILRPKLCIVDGIIGMGGAQGPSFGVPIPAGVIIGGLDPVAVDAACSHIIGFRPFFIGHIRKSKSRGIGSMRYSLVGDEPPNVDFEISTIDRFAFKVGLFLQGLAKKESSRVG